MSSSPENEVVVSEPEHARPLTVVIVSRHRPTLRKMSRFLLQFGYSVIQARNLEQMQMAIENRSFDFLVVDRTQPERHHAPVEIGPIIAAARNLRPWVYTILLAENLTINVLKQALKLGVDDFLGLPLNLGETLVRLRAGARVVEHRRRGRQSGHLDSVTGLLTQSVFTETLARRLEVAQNAGSSIACVAVNLDFCQRYRSDYGQSFYECVLAGVAANFAAVHANNTLLGCGELDQFFVAVDSQNDDDTVEWVQQFVEEFTSRTIAVNDVPVKVSATVGVATTNAEPIDAIELVRRALEAQELSKRSGRNTIATYQEVVDENTDWNDMAAPSALLKDTTAVEVMTPCTIAVQASDLARDAADRMRRARLSVLPVIDEAEQLLGYLTDASWTDATTAEAVVADVMETEMDTFDERAYFAELINHFVESPRSLVFIVRQGQPLGWVTQRTLVTLSDSLNNRSFATSAPASHRTSYLVVADEATTVA